MKVYVIAGKAGCGKNTSANYIKKYYEENGKSAVITEFSKYLKTFAYEIKNWDGTRENKPRAFMQELGSLIRYELFDEDFFINRLIEDLRIYEKLVDVVIIADARLPKEIDSLKDKVGATSIKIVNKFSDYELKGNENKHETETALDNYSSFDFVVNNETFDKLEEDMKNIVKKVENNE